MSKKTRQTVFLADKDTFRRDDFDKNKENR